ncbi:hypothetical protein BJ138DRAFT_1155506 [Hygrophoropsis aurantiaca]|uniref:Uncharacterized protein n=1 Tax=Hygrophoropsis aurantiaca TaxID=72124 RepID=A0ACB8A8D4_9AGAM|nr:hypothetical protein BJ138DRAFT_1155506 [Hygrophoropsis aurantiaca]
MSAWSFTRHARCYSWRVLGIYLNGYSPASCGYLGIFMHLQSRHWMSSTPLYPSHSFDANGQEQKTRSNMGILLVTMIFYLPLSIPFVTRVS